MPPKLHNALLHLPATRMALLSCFQAPLRSDIAKRLLLQRHGIAPTIYPYRFFTVDGGLMSYASDVLDSYRRAASYVDRILRGAKVAELPVQQPIKYELTINVQTAKTLGLALPDSVLATADEVIE